MVNSDESYKKVFIQVAKALISSNEIIVNLLEQEVVKKEGGIPVQRLAMHLKFCANSQFACGKSGHPQEIMKELGIRYQHVVPQTMCDCWWFWNCENIPSELPKYLTEMKLNPMECIGNGLSITDAEKIRDYRT